MTSIKEPLIFASAGLIAWLVATVFYGVFGATLIEASFWFYAMNAAVAALAFGAVFRGLGRARRLNGRQWGYAAVAFALPGLVLELAVFANMNVLFADTSPETLGRYAGFIAFVYLTLPALAWPADVKLSKARAPSSDARPAQ